MLKSIRLRNFQKHIDRTIVIDPHVTAIIGRNDQGKSSIIRAIYWACFNQPTGDWMIKHGETRTQVTLTFDSGKVVRGKGQTNVYLHDGKKYVAFGAGKVPDDIAAFLNVGPINFQQQDDGHFWISNSAAEVSRQLNAVVDLDIIDRSLGNIQSSIRQAKAATSVCGDRLAIAQKRKAELAYVPRMVVELKKIEAIESATINLRYKSRRIASLLEETVTLTETRRRALAATWGASNAVSLGQAAKDLGERVVKLHSLLGKIETVRGVVPPSDIKPIQKLVDRIVDLRNRTEQLAVNLDSIEMEDRCLNQAKKESTALAKEVKERTKGMCPVCGCQMNPA